MFCGIWTSHEVYKMAYKFYLFILCSLVTYSKTSRRSHPNQTRAPSKAIKTDIGYIQPIVLHAGPKLNISTLMGSGDHRHQLSYYVSERENKKESPQRQEGPQRQEVVKETQESEEDRYVKEQADEAEREDEPQVNNDDNEDSEVSPVMRNSPPLDDELFYDFDDEELTITFKK